MLRSSQVALSILVAGASASQVNEGRSMCDALQAHLDILEPQVRQQQEKAGIDDDEVSRRFAEIRADFPVFKAFEDQNKPTEVVQMNMPQSLNEQIMEDVYNARKVEQKLRSLMNSTVTGYNPFKLEFDNAALFVPSCTEFMNLNRDVVRNNFPQMRTCQCNAFVVEKGTNAYGFHHASASGYEFGELFHHGVLVPEHHMSFHTAVTASNFSSNPFTIFDGAIPEVLNNHFLARHFRSIESTLPSETMKLVKAAVLMYEEQTDFTHLRMLQDYLHAVYYQVTHCGKGSPNLQEEPGKYWDLEPGQALYFNNWRVHGDSGLGSSEHDRVTMDLRCHSELKVPSAFRDSYDFTRSVSPHLVNGYEKASQCLLSLFNYSSPGDFLETVFGREMPNGVAYYSGLGNLGLTDAGEVSLLHENSLEGMRKHNARVRDAYKTGNLNYDAFMSCFEDNIMAFDERFREAPLPWSFLDNVLIYPKLYISFAPASLNIFLGLSMIMVCFCIKTCKGQRKQKRV